MLCSVYLPCCTSSSLANTSVTPSLGPSLAQSGASLAYRQHLSSTHSFSVRQWFGQQHTPFSGLRTSRFVGVISNTAPPVLSHSVRQQVVVRGISRKSFSASATVEHSSSTRRKANNSGVPFQLNAALSLLCLRLISLIVTESPASFMPLMTPQIGEMVTAANARFPSPL